MLTSLCLWTDPFQSLVAADIDAEGEGGLLHSLKKRAVFQRRAPVEVARLMPRRRPQPRWDQRRGPILVWETVTTATEKCLLHHKKLCFVSPFPFTPFSNVQLAMFLSLTLHTTVCCDSRRCWDDGRTRDDVDWSKQHDVTCPPAAVIVFSSLLISQK